MTRTKWIGLAGILLVVGIVYKFTMPSAPSIDKEIIPVSVSTFSQTIKAPGTVAPLNRTQVFPSLGGRIEEILVNEGDSVKAGQVLAVMSSFERATVLDNAQSDTPEKLAYWKKVYQPTKLFAPVTGKVIVRNINAGQTVSNETELFVIADRLMIKAQVDETDLGKIRLNLPVTVTLDTYPDQPVNGKIARISFESTVINNVSVYYVQISLDQIPAHFLSGMSASVTIYHGKKTNALTLPDRAIRQEDNRCYVLVEDPRTKDGYRRQLVHIGAQSNGLTEIRSGLVKTDRIVILSPKATESKPLEFYPFNQNRKS